MKSEIIPVGKRGTIVIPKALRKRLGVNEGDVLIVEDHGDGILIRPAIVLPVETYSLERKAEFILSNATTKEDYKNACQEVRKLGLDPAKIKHHKPSH
jgi:AbrB family looped-hinge helix DNA binding protein